MRSQETSMEVSTTMLVTRRKMDDMEMTEREIAALHHENTGAQYNRIGYIKDRFMEAKIDAALKEDEVKK
jgi:hypothetical protein